MSRDTKSLLRCGILSFLCASAVGLADPQNRPHIVMIIADDMGWDDVSFHGSDQIQTPNIDALAYGGVALKRYYSNCQCTPSRSALLTGKYAHRLGMQGYPLTNSEDRAIPLNEKLLPSYLKDLGYATHLVGKWHVGNSRKEFLPTRRGFDSHFGYRGGFVDYYEYTSEARWPSGRVFGFDLYRNETAAWDVEGYLTDVFTDEASRIIREHETERPLFLQLAHLAPHSANEGALLQAPPAAVRSQRHIESSERRVYAGMVKKLDDSVGVVVKTLEERLMLNNTIIVFISDNGGMTTGNAQNWASNYPLRGIKMSPFEGGVRVVGLIWSTKIESYSHVWPGLMHVTDWLPTLLDAAEGDIPFGIDGVSQWKSIINNEPSKRTNITVEIDDFTGYSSLILDPYKIVIGDPNVDYSQYHGNDLRGVIGEVPRYLEDLERSEVTAALKNTGKPIKSKDNVDIKNTMRINCKGKVDNGCFPKTKEKVCLYNIEEDPCEREDISESMPHVVQDMVEAVSKEWARRIPRVLPLYREPASHPSLHNNTWNTWVEDKSIFVKNISIHPFK